MDIQDWAREVVDTLAGPDELRRLLDNFDYDPVYREWGFDPEIRRTAMTVEQEAVERVSNYLREIFVKITGKAPDPQAVRDEAEAFVAKYGPAAVPEDMMD
jgi:hypothetical protein